MVGAEPRRNAQLERYTDLPADLNELHRLCAGDAVDLDGTLPWRDGEMVLARGKHEGATLRELAAKVPDYLRWMLGADFGTEVKMHVRNALQGRFAEKKQAA